MVHRYSNRLNAYRTYY